MKPEFSSRRVFGITRAKGKMFEFGLAESSHLAIPADVEPSSVFPLTIGILADVASSLNDSIDADVPLPSNTLEEIGFAASFFDAYLESRFGIEYAHDVLLMASSSYYLGRRPGSSLVLARRIDVDASASAIDRLLVWLLCSNWSHRPELEHDIFGEMLNDLVREVADHFQFGFEVDEIEEILNRIRRSSYSAGSSRDLLLIEVASAVVRLRLTNSVWNTLPKFSGISLEQWASAIQRSGFPKELWPSQKLLGQAGIFAGQSAVIQMPTSAGKTRSVEIMLRSSFLSGRSKLAVIVAPFRALSHEIATSLRQAFKGEDVKVNELTDAMQLDFADELAELFGQEIITTRFILTLTPEKLLYVLRQKPQLVGHIGVVVYDEGHQFDSGSRGVTYELLLTEIKRILPISAQTILISAVIKNAEAVGNWLIGKSAKIVDGSGLLPTARSVGFATWAEHLGQLQFFESDSYDRPDYFVPRTIETQILKKRARERTERTFPTRGDDSWKDISLYLGIRLAPQGAAAIFCGRKDTASGMARRAVEVYERGFNLQPPSKISDLDEIQRLTFLIQSHFGDEADLAKAAQLGVFVHHGNTPHGLRMAIEYAMQNALIKLVICTSTLAQGVNLPIRYLIVSGINQGADRIKTRDFQNLIGRAGRAGMHTEGLIVFADPRTIDNRRSESWRFNAAIELLKSENSEDTTSSILALLAPLPSPNYNYTLPISADELCVAYFLNETEQIEWVESMGTKYIQLGFTPRLINAELRKRKKLLAALESYLMANRGTDAFAEFKVKVFQLTKSTLAYFMATEEQKSTLVKLFELTTQHIEDILPDVERQASYAKTLLGVEDAKYVETWVVRNKEILLSLTSNREWLDVIWPLLGDVIDDKFFGGVTPAELPRNLAMAWLNGSTYGELIEFALASDAAKPWGEESKRALAESDVVDFLEGTLGFDCPLVLASVAQFLFEDLGGDEERAAFLMLFQKSLKYGLPNWLSISCYERGFADRFLAFELSEGLKAVGYDNVYFEPAMKSHRLFISMFISEYPKYFTEVFDSI